MGELGLTYAEYCDRTLFELTAEIAGYNVRWEENVKPFRSLYTLIYNTNFKKKKTELELMPLPSEMQELADQKKQRRNKEFSELLDVVKARGDGSRISDKI